MTAKQMEELKTYLRDRVESNAGYVEAMKENPALWDGYEANYRRGVIAMAECALTAIEDIQKSR